MIASISISVHISCAGIGGSTAAYFLTRSEELAVTVFERDEVGGRAATVEINKRKYEAGGSIIHNSNRFMRDFVELPGCNLGVKKPLSGETFSLLNDNGIIFQVKSLLQLNYYLSY